MKFSEVQKDIIRYIKKYKKSPEKMLIPSIDTLSHIFEGKYSRVEIEKAVGELVSNCIIQYFSFHAYLDFTETFKSSFNDTNNMEI